MKNYQIIFQINLSEFEFFESTGLSEIIGIIASIPIILFYL